MAKADDCGLRMSLAMEIHSHGIVNELRALESIEAKQTILDIICNREYIA